MKKSDRPPAAAASIEVPAAAASVRRPRAGRGSPAAVADNGHRDDGNGSSTLDATALFTALTALKRGDFSVRLPMHWAGLAGKTADAFNDVVALNERMARELARLRQAVGREGRIQQRASLGDVGGSWADSVGLINDLITDLVQPPSEMARVIGAVAKGDLSQTMTLEIDGRPLEGEFLRTARTVNTMVDQLGSFASEVTRVAREVGTEGKLGGQADVRGVAGTWKDLTDNVNLMASNLTGQVRNVAEVTTAVANGDLAKKITVDVKGEFLELKNTINTMVDQLRSFASEVTRVAREVGTEGRLGGQADVRDVSGTWKDLTDSVNFMAGNLTSQVRNIADVTTAVANGDLSRKITVDVKGEILELKNTINTMVDQLNSFASEVTRVAREVGTEGKLGGQADVRGVAGTWKDLTDSVNSMAGNLTAQVRNIADVTTAVANGDLAKKITVDVRGEILELKNTINTMVDQLSSFAAEVTRVAREVGTEGKLGGQARVEGVSGTWRGLTDNVNLMASNLTGQVRNIADVTTAVANGDLSKKITVDVRGEILELKNTINTMVDQLNSFASEVTRVAREVGTEGKLGGQADVRGVAGTWKDLTDNVNFMAGNLTGQVRNIAQVTTAVANGDLSKKITVDVKGEILELKDTINIMVDQLNSFASEVTRVAREVGTEGKLGGQADVRGVSGTWKDLTDNVNFMAGNLTNQVRGVAKVVTAVANGDLKRKLLVEAKGEIAELADTINNMIDTLATFADQVTTVAREVGTEGKLGGQSNVPGAAGTWRDLNDNVNQLAAALTNQLRAISDVATAVTKGDLTRSVTVDARGEVAVLKDTVNEMIRNLKDTTSKNAEQDWLKTNLAKFTRMLQGQRDLMTVGKMILSELAPVVSAQQGVFYLVQNTAASTASAATTAAGGNLADGGDHTRIRLLASYAFRERKHAANEFRPGEGLVGQAVLEKERILLTNVPSDYVATISSGLGEAPPANIIVLPVVFEGQVKAVIELSSFQRFSPTHQAFLDQLTESIGIVLNTIEANGLTEDLLKQSQSLTNELQSRQLQLQQTNLELEQKARQLVDQNAEVERKNSEVENKNREVEQARQALEEKARQLALTSKYKSEFLANMSHELRTPLNSLLILADQLAGNPDGNLSARQVEFSKTIHGSGKDLLHLINDILDLSKIESGTVTVDLRNVPLREVRESMERTFRHVAQSKGLAFDIELAPGLPGAVQTDSQRLDQVLKNLLSNAFKFTERGRVMLRVAPAASGWSADHAGLNRAAATDHGGGGVLAFSVRDTGIGIAPEKQSLIFEAFQQADGSTSRKYGGTGLGLAISREIARLLGGELALASIPGQGSTFTIFLPLVAAGRGGESQISNLKSQISSPPASTPPPGVEPFIDRPLTTPTPPTVAVGTPPPPLLAPAAPTMTTTAAPEDTPDTIPDDRARIQPGDKVLLIIEDDPNFAPFLYDLGHAHGFKCLVATRGQTGLALAREFCPDAITLDLSLPDLDGWRVLDRLKGDLLTRHLPVTIISVTDEPERALRLGGAGFVTKPASRDELNAAFARIRRFVDRPMKQLLVVEDDETQRNAVVELIGNGSVQTTAVADAERALALLEQQTFDCLVVDLLLPGEGMSGDALVEIIKKEPRHRDLPIIIYTGKSLSPEEEARLNRLAQSVIFKDVRSPERLFDQTALWLHRDPAKLPAHQRRILETLHHPDAVLAGKKVLLVDDDIRNIFAMTSLLERYRMEIVPAESGPEALERLAENPDVDIILMDIMLPEMDGYEATRRIRQQPAHASLPILALTAKAMKGDREKCLEAGCSDYIAKPVDTEALLSLLRLYLHR